MSLEYSSVQQCAVYVQIKSATANSAILSLIDQSAEQRLTEHCSAHWLVDNAICTAIKYCRAGHKYIYYISVSAEQDTSIYIIYVCTAHCKQNSCRAQLYTKHYTEYYISSVTTLSIYIFELKYDLICSPIVLPNFATLQYQTRVFPTVCHAQATSPEI